MASIAGLEPVRGWKPVHPSVVDPARPNVIVLEPSRRSPSRHITVHSRGGSLELARAILAHSRKSYEVLPGGNDFGDGTRVIAGDPEEKVFGPAEYLKALSKDLGTVLPDAALTRYRRFFFELDRHTESTLLEHNPFSTPTLQEASHILKALPFVYRALTVRMDSRMGEHREAPYRYTPFQDVDSFGHYIETISKVFLRLLKETFHDPH